MAQTYATPDDVKATWLGSSPLPSDEQVQALLNAAYVKVLAKVPTLEARVQAGTVSSDAVKLVLVEMVQAVCRNPTGARSGSESTGPFARSWSWDPAAAAGRLTVTDEQREMLGDTDSDAYTVPVRDDGLPHISIPAPARYREWW